MMCVCGLSLACSHVNGNLYSDLPSGKYIYYIVYLRQFQFFSTPRAPQCLNYIIYNMYSIINIEIKLNLYLLTISTKLLYHTALHVVEILNLKHIFTYYNGFLKNPIQ